MYQALYRKWRPQSFADVIGQGAVTETLAKQVETGKLSHAYLFSGSRGTGKTTCAKILARAANCENPFHGNPCNKCPSCLGILDGGILDVVEIDAASNNGVDNVRDLRDEAIYSPANVKRRVYIIDEVHMFSSSAFNALLKIMEEPPAHVMFILATTELHKVPATIASRCQKFVFKRISASTIAERLMFIARSEGANLGAEAAGYIASLADGAMRDAVSLLDQCLSLGSGEVSIETVEGALGLAGRAQTFALAEAIAARQTGSALSILNDIYTGGRNLASVLTELSEILRDVLILKTAPGEKIPRIDARYTESELSALCDRFDTFRLISAIETLTRATSAIAVSTNRRIDAELACIRLCESAGSEDTSAIASRISELERKISSGAFVSSTPSDVKKSVENPPAPVKNEATVPREAKPAPKKEAPAKSTSADDENMWKKILEVAKAKLSPGIYPLFAGAKATRDGGMLVLSSENLFVLKMLAQKENMDILRSTAESLGFDVTITARQMQKEKQETSGLDELLSGIADKSSITIRQADDIDNI